jgi:hypothetical protein
MAGENMVNVLDSVLLGQERPEYLCTSDDDSPPPPPPPTPPPGTSKPKTRKSTKRKAKEKDNQTQDNHSSDDETKGQGKKSKTRKKTNDSTQPMVNELVSELLGKVDLSREQLYRVLESNDLPRPTRNEANQMEISLQLHQSLVFELEIQKAIIENQSSQQSSRQQTMGKRKADNDSINYNKRNFSKVQQKRLVKVAKNTCKFSFTNRITVR